MMENTVQPQINSDRWSGFCSIDKIIEEITMKKMAFLMATIIMAAGLSSCGGSSGSPAPSTTPPAISAQPADQSVILGETASFSVTATGSNLTYQWLKNGVAISGATGATYITPPVAMENKDEVYSVKVANAGGTVTSNGATLTLKPSDEQLGFESMSIAPNAQHRYIFNLPYSGVPVSGTHYLMARTISFQESPLTHGPQTASFSALINMADSLDPQTDTIPTRFLINGSIVVGSLPGVTRVTYKGEGFESENIAADGTTVVSRHMGIGYTNPMALSGTIASAPNELANWFGALYFNPLLLNPAATWAPGSAYVAVISTVLADYYEVVDYAAVQSTTDANVIPAVINSTLQNAMSAGIQNNTDGVTYNLTNGSIGSLNGIPIYTPINPRPNRTTERYLVFFELNGNVYGANYYKAGTVIGGNVYAVALQGGGYNLKYDQKYQIRLNKAAAESIQAAFMF